MAIVANKGRVDQVLDTPWCSPNRTTGADPNGVLTPQFAGELVLDTANKKIWESINLTNTSWVTHNVGPRTA